MIIFLSWLSIPFWKFDCHPMQPEDPTRVELNEAMAGEGGAKSLGMASQAAFFS
jgi:hypothetical protein